MVDVKPPLRPFNGALVPPALKAASRWSPWVAVWDAERQNYGKKPHQGRSIAKPETWLTYDAAVATHERMSPATAGVGYLMNPPHGVVGVDLDKHLQGGEITAEGWELIRLLNSYTEFSPTKGLRILGFGETTRDWTNHEAGVEVYAGHKSRFLTVTGAHVPGTPAQMRHIPTELLEDLRGRYGSSANVQNAPAADMPDLLPDLLLPDLGDLDLPYAVRDFLAEGATRGDRSREVHAAAVALYQCGLSDDEVFSFLAANSFAMEVALDHRRQDTDRALAYLWKEHTTKAKGKGGSRVATADDFEDVSGAGGATVAEAMKKTRRFQVLSVPELLQRPRAEWLIRGVLPRTGIAMVYGDSGSGKSFFVLDLAAAIARGLDWRGHKVQNPHPVVYVCAEGEADFRDRVQAYCAYNALQDFPIGVVPDAPNLLIKDDVRDLVSAVKAFGSVSMIVVDTLAQTVPGANENSGEDMGRALAHCKALGRVTGALVLLVHHSGKDSAKGARGWSGLRAAVDAELEVARFGAGDFSDPRMARVSKLKGGRDGAEFGFRLNLVEVGQYEDGETISSCVILADEVKTKAQRKTPPKGNEQLVLRVAQTLLDMDDIVTSEELIDAAAAQMVAPEKGKSDNRRRDARRALESLVAGNLLGNDSGRIKVL